MRKYMRKFGLALAAVTALGALRSTAATLATYGVQDGSAIQETFTASGTSVSFDYNFLSNDNVNNDIAFYTLQGPGITTSVVPFASSVSNINPPGTVQPTLAPSPSQPDLYAFLSSGLGKQTGKQTLTISGLTSGQTYTLSIGVADATTSQLSSGLLLDALQGSNGGFENGTLSGFTSIGDATVQEDGFQPIDGSFSALLTTLTQQQFSPGNPAVNQPTLAAFVGASTVPLPAAALLAPLGMAIAGGFAKKLRRKAAC